MLRIALLIVALAAGGAAAWVAFNMRGEPAPTATVTEPAAPAAMQDVLVASVDLGLGQALSKENMRWQSWPEGSLSPGYIVRSARPNALETLANSLVRDRMSAGEPIRTEKLVPANAGFLSTLLPPGKRAVAVRISAESSAGGFVLPNDRVDVLLTAATDGKGEHLTRTILRNVPVLAIDQTIDAQGKDEKDEKDEKNKSKAGVIGKTATLELDPSQVEILAAGEATGTISLALRSAADNAEGPPPLPLPPEPPPSTQTIKRFKSGSIEIVEIVTSPPPAPAARTAPRKPFEVKRAPGRLQEVRKDAPGAKLQ
jgi:pilus assembly protein CpaB